MTINNLPRTRKPTHAAFRPVLHAGRLPAVAGARPSLTVPMSARAGALVAGIVLALAVLAVPAGALTFTVAQLNPALTARNAAPTETVQSVQTDPATRTAITGSRP